MNSAYGNRISASGETRNFVENHLWHTAVGNLKGRKSWLRGVSKQCWWRTWWSSFYEFSRGFAGADSESPFSFRSYFSAKRISNVQRSWI